jgi:hypothetical protein
LSKTILIAIFYHFRDVIIEIPEKTKRNGSLTAMIVIAPRDEFNKYANSLKIQKTLFSQIKKTILSKYQLNATKKFVNLLESANNQIADDSNVKESTEQVKIESSRKDEKPIVYLVNKLNLHGIDREFDIYKSQLPSEIMGDLMYEF